MSTATTPPGRAEADGRTWRISRAWPLGEEPADGLAVEADAGQGSVRAGLWRGGVLELLPVGADPKLKPLPELAEQGTVVSHRLHKRAVVRVERGGHTEFVKVVRTGRTAGILTGIEQARAFAAGFRTPEVLGTTDATVTFAGLPGLSLHASDEFTDQQWRRAWGDVAGALLHSHGAATSVPDVPARHHGLEDEARVLEQWYARAADWVTDPAGLRELVAASAADLLRLEVHFWAPTHRDLHDKQLLWDPELGPGLLDVDTACLSHPGLDLGNLRAHARWRVLQGLWSEDRADEVRATVDRMAESLGVEPREVAVFERATLVRIRCVYAFRPGHAEAAQHLQELLG